MSTTYDLMEVRPQTSCDEGGDPHIASKWLETNGTKEEKCWPYSLIKEHSWVAPNKLPSDCCSNCCDPKITPALEVMYSVQPGSTRTLAVVNGDKIDKDATIAAIQREIMSNGPVVCGFQVFDDFSDYWGSKASSGEIYVCNNRGESGGHAVTLTGWGTGQLSNGKTVRYWELRNSWGKSGDNGYCKIGFSTDVPENVVLQVDIPAEVEKDAAGNILFSGGTFAFIPGAKPVIENNSIIEKFSNESDKCSTKFMGLNMHISIVILIIIAIIIVISLLLFLIIKKH